MESELLTCLTVPPELDVSKYDAFISVLASAGATSNFFLLVIIVLALNSYCNCWFHLQTDKITDQIIPKVSDKTP